MTDKLMMMKKTKRETASERKELGVGLKLVEE
jgi:hypothetical protein